MPAVLKYLLSKGLIDGTCLTVTGKCSARCLQRRPPYGAHMRSVRPGQHHARRRFWPDRCTPGCPHCRRAAAAIAGKSLAENLADCPDLTEGQQVIMPLETPIKSSGHLQILYGNLAPQV